MKLRMKEILDDGFDLFNTMNCQFHGFSFHVYNSLLEDKRNISQYELTVAIKIKLKKCWKVISVWKYEA